MLSKTLVILLMLVPASLVAQETELEDVTTADRPLSAQAIEDKLEGDYRSEDIAAANSWVQTIGLADWLGPLAPVALSPFFGVTCLSALAIWGPESLTNNALLGSSGPLKSETLFFVFLALTILTSLPRLTKVSKPFAQATDRLETYAVIVILLAIKIIASYEASSDAQPQVAMIQFGVLSFTADTLLAIAMVINVLVINSVKFFFEFLAWLTPLPTIDAIFEICNKALCAALMTVYAFSPTIATILNLAMLFVAAIALRWIGRRVRFYRTIVLDPVIARLWSKYGNPGQSEFVVFCKKAYGPFAAKSRLRLARRGSEEGWSLREANWWMPSGEHPLDASARPRIRRGWVMHTIVITDASGKECEFAMSRRYDHALETIADRIGLIVDSASRDNEPSKEVAVEFA